MTTIAITTDSNMKTKFNVLSPCHLIAPFVIFFIAMYISIGKYMVIICQNPMAPKRVNISLKKGIADVAHVEFVGLGSSSSMESFAS